jgi:hypothetical protein
MPWLDDDANDMSALSAATDLDASTVFIVEKALPWLYEKCYQRTKVGGGFSRREAVADA